MGKAGRLALLVVSIFEVSVAGAAELVFPSPDDWLQAHNAERIPLGIAPLVWSTQAEQQSKIWAEHLAQSKELQHSGVAGMGENIYYAAQARFQMLSMDGRSGAPPASAAVQSWASEKSEFNSVTKTCKGGWQACGHYSQIIWSGTTSVGCAEVAVSPDRRRNIYNDEFYVVCNYLPQGNIVGQTPY